MFEHNCLHFSLLNFPFVVVVLFELFLPISSLIIPTYRSQFNILRKGNLYRKRRLQ